MNVHVGIATAAITSWHCVSTDSRFLYCYILVFRITVMCRLGDLLCFVFIVWLLYVWFVCVLYVPSVLWYCWWGLLTCKNRLPYNLYCVGVDVKHCSIQSMCSHFVGWGVRCFHLSRDRLGEWPLMYRDLTATAAATVTVHAVDWMDDMMCADLEVYITAWAGSTDRHFCQDTIHNWPWQPDVGWSFHWSFWPRRYVWTNIFNHKVMLIVIGHKDAVTTFWLMPGF